MRVSVSLHPDELDLIQSASDAPASFIRDAALRAAKRAATKRGSSSTPIGPDPSS